MKAFARFLGRGLDFFLDTVFMILSGAFLLLLFLLGARFAASGEWEGILAALVALLVGALFLLYSRKDKNG